MSSSEYESSGSDDEHDEYDNPHLGYLLRGRVDGGLLATVPDVASLAAWLKVHSPRDVLMPAVRKEKRPGFAHAGGAWTWARWDWQAQTAEAAQYDCGLLLFDLCVIDCDTVEVADALEAEWPELAAAPMETTARGRHYYLLRSAKADTHGYYDGSAQRRTAVDFKSRTWGGTSGFVVTAPSANKARVGSKTACAARIGRALRVSGAYRASGTTVACARGVRAADARADAACCTCMRIAPSSLLAC